MTDRAEEFPCTQLVELVTEYLEGTLAADVRELIDEHLEICEGCTNYLDQVRATIALTGRLREDDVTPEMHAELARAFRDWSSRRPESDG